MAHRTSPSWNAAAMKPVLAFALAAALVGGAHAVDVHKWKDGRGVARDGARICPQIVQPDYPQQ